MSKRRRRSRGLRGMVASQQEQHQRAFAHAAKRCAGRRGRAKSSCMSTVIRRYHAGH